MAGDSPTPTHTAYLLRTAGLRTPGASPREGVGGGRIAHAKGTIMQRPTAPSRLFQLLLLLLLACALPARAEMAAQLSLRGRVLDPNGAAVAGALVTAEAKGRPAVYSAA